MKIYLFIILLALLVFPSCSQVNPIVENICDITEEICYYSNLICENWIPSDNNAELDQKEFNELQSIRDEVIILQASLNTGQPINKKEVEVDAVYKLIQIREDLKRMYQRQLILKRE